MRRTLLALALATACRSRPVENPETVGALVADGTRRVAPALDLAVEIVATELPSDDGEYRLGTGDVLHISVPGHPEFSNFRDGRDETGADRPGGVSVKPDGNVYLPYVGAVPARARTVLELQNDLRQRLERFIADPFVSVDVLRFQSQRYYVLGAVNLPGVFQVDGQARLLDGVGRAGGIRPNGDVEGAYVVRGRTLLPISLGDMLLRGDTSRNVVMRDGDLVYVPDASQWRVYVLGEVAKPGPVDLPPSGLSLAAALASAGGLDRVNADRNVIRIFRGSWQAPQAFTLSEEDVLRHGTAIAMKPGDRIHVAPRPLATWSRTLTLMLPFLQSTLTGVATAAAFEE